MEGGDEDPRIGEKRELDRDNGEGHEEIMQDEDEDIVEPSGSGEQEDSETEVGRNEGIDDGDGDGNGDANDNDHDNNNENENASENDDDNTEPPGNVIPANGKQRHNSNSNSNKKYSHSYRTPKMFEDAITVFIPLDVTADLRIAIQNTRAKRIASIYKRFPSLLRNANAITDDKLGDNDDPIIDDDDEESAREKQQQQQQQQQQPPRKRKKLDHVPQPEQYGSVLDYLEAKYVKGVMLEEEDDGPILDDKSEGHGSVYSKDSFLDDTDLQRDVAEQVMASTTLTKLELEHEDGDFFVNVGALEVENDDYGENYDPLQDKENKTTKKRKKPSTPSAAGSASKSKSNSNTNTNSNTNSNNNVNKTPTPKSKKAKTEHPTKKKEPTSAKSKKSSGGSVAFTKSKKTEDRALKSAAKKAKTLADSLYKKAVAMIKKLTTEELPRMKTKMKVALKCPKNKKPGDDITFANPHNLGQKLRVKVPKDCFPGGTFKVTVPVKHRPGDADHEKDRNKLPRDLQEALDVFGKAYDEWCTAQSKVDGSFETFKEKQGKFDKLAKLFPKDLITPIDAHYLKQVVRRARQNKYKRSKTAAAAAAKSTRESSASVTSNSNSKEKTSSNANANAKGGDAEDDDESAKDDSDEEEQQRLPPQKQYRVIDIPATGVQYPNRTFTSGDFLVNN